VQHIATFEEENGYLKKTSQLTAPPDADNEMYQDFRRSQRHRYL